MQDEALLTMNPEAQFNGSGTVPVTVRGVLDCVSFAGNSCEIAYEGQTISCTFPDSLKPAVKNALGNFIEASGRAVRIRERAHNSRIKEVRLERIGPLEQRSLRIKPSPELVAQVISDLDALEAHEDVTADEFYDAIKAVRKLRNQEPGE